MLAAAADGRRFRVCLADKLRASRRSRLQIDPACRVIVNPTRRSVRRTPLDLRDNRVSRRQKSFAILSKILLGIANAHSHSSSEGQERTADHRRLTGLECRLLPRQTRVTSDFHKILRESSHVVGSACHPPDCFSYFAPGRVQSVVMSISVCPLTTQKPHDRTSPNFFACCMALALSSSVVSVAICYVLPVLLMTSCSHTMGPVGMQNQARLYV